MKLNDLTTAAKWRTTLFAVVRCAGVAFLFGLAVAPVLAGAAQGSRDDPRRCEEVPALLQREAGRRKERCAAGDGWRTAADEPQPRYRSPKSKAKPKAKSPTEAPKETGYVECKSCSFRFLRSYQKVHRLCFPAVGVRASGKTHMLATGYDRVRRRTAPTVAVVQPAPSLGDARFENYIDMILHLKRDAGGTVHAMPDPVMLHVRDADPEGSNTALVNLFDYSGELVDSSVDVDRLKKQAVKMDGFILFLDPTQLYGDGANLTLDRQIAKLNEFMADMGERAMSPWAR